MDIKSGNILVLDCYAEFLSQSYLFSQTTIFNYFTIIKSFVFWCTKNNIYIKDVNINDIVSYFKEKKLSSNSQYIYIICFQGFGSFLNSYFNSSSQVFFVLDMPHKEYKLPKVLSVAQVDLFLASINRNTDIGFRDYCIFEFIYSTGLRVSELCELKISDIHFNKNIALVHGKGNKERFVIFHSSISESLCFYISHQRNFVLRNNTDYLFLSLRGDKLSRKTIWERYKIYEKKAGLSGTHVHTLRHCFATHLYENDVSIEIIRELLGHSNLNTTCIYTHISGKMLEKEHKKYFH